MPVSQSSHIQSHSYHEAEKYLDIQFTNGAIYRYLGVDPNTYYAFAQSASPGSYFHTKIRGKFAAGMIASPPETRGKSRKRR